jgi:Secretion system C-terminal sorting domain
MQNLQRSIFIAIVTMFLAELLQGQTYGTFGPSQSTYQRMVLKYNSNNPQSTGLSDLQHDLSIGNDGTYKYRVFYQWNIPDILIPAGSTIDTVQIQFQYYYVFSGNHPLPVYYHNAGLDLVSPDLVTLWSNAETGMLLGWTTGSQNAMSFTQGPGTGMANAIAGALSSHSFTLGLRYQDEASYDTAWFVKNSTVTLRIVFTRPLHPVIVDQQVTARSSSIDSIDHWETNSWLRYKAPKTLPMVVGTDELLKATQKLLQGKKYNNWTTDNEVTNYKKFTISSQTSNLTAKVDTVQNATIQTAVLEGGNPVGGIGFKDPWLVDSVDVSHINAPMNRGMANAVFRSVSSASHNLDTNTSYKGVFLNQRYDIPNNPYYTVRAPQTIDFGGAIGVRNVYLQSWRAIPANSASFQDSLASQTGVVFNTGGATVSANVKGSMLSNTASTFSNNSQRKIVRTPGNGWLHQVYESMGHVWYELSTDGGLTWTLQSPTDIVVGSNTIQGTPGPLDNGSGKNPSIDFDHSSTEATSIVIVFQQKSGNYSSIAEITYAFDVGWGNYWVSQNSMTIWTEPAGGDLYASTNANPNISDQGYIALLVWERKSSAGGFFPGINYYVGQFSSLPGFCYYPPPPGSYPLPIAVSPTDTITGTSANSINASIAGEYIPLPAGVIDFAIAWEQYTSGAAGSIKYCYILPDVNGNYYPYFTTPNTVSNSSYVKNTKPSIVILPDASVRVGWIANLTGSGDPYSIYAMLRNPATSVFNTYGLNYQSVSLQTTNNSSTYYMALSRYWSNAWTNYALKGDTSLGMKTLNTTGSDIQLSNGSSNATMYVSSFYPFSLPYYFKTSQNLNLSGLSKSTSDPISYGRGVTIGQGNLQFSYSIDNLTVDGNNINFVDAPDSMNYKDLGNVNKVFVTQPFSITSKSQFIFNENAGFVDSMAASKVLGKSGSIGCKVELIDNTSGKVIGTIKNMAIQFSNTQSNKTISYTLNTAAIGSKTVMVRITVSTNLPSSTIALEKKYYTVNTATTLAKSSVNDLTIAELDVPASYALEQNYPNPFNPSTTIHYQIPNAGHVLLKVYDMLGREVATLVDGVKEVGFYSATFDGARLASGVYISRLTAGNYTKTMKMVLMK